MSEIVKQWIQDKLGIIVNLRPETFCEITKDGFLLSKILRAYEIINDDQLKQIRPSDTKEICYQNYEHIVGWLKMLNINVKQAEIEDVVESRGLTSLSLFYKLFLELNEKDCLTFIAHNKLNQKLHPCTPKFPVINVKENPYDKLKAMDNKYKEYIEHSYDVIHWLQDRFEMVISRCKSARDEYRCLAGNSKRKVSNEFHFPLTTISCEPTIENISERTLNLTYDELEEESRKCRLKTFQPNPIEAQIVLDRIKDKLKRKAENEIFRKELEKCVRQTLWGRIMNQEKEDFYKEITEKITKQTIYEKQMLQKMQEVKKQKNQMLKAKKIVTDQIEKENENIIEEKLIEKEDSLDSKKLQYYLEKDRALELHRVLFAEAQKLKEERRQKVCNDTVKGIRDAAIKHSEYKELFNEPPPQYLIDTWYKKVILGQDLFAANVSPKELIRSDSQLPVTTIQNEISMQNQLDAKYFESYLNFEWPWLLDNIEANEKLVYDMKCGMNVLGHKVHLLLYERYPLAPLPPPPISSNIGIKVCVTGVPDLACLPLLAKLLSYKKILVVEIQDALNYCTDAFKVESSAEVEDDSKNDEDEQELKKEKKQKPSKGKKRPKNKSKMEFPTYTSPIEHADKRVQTPKFYPCEKIILSPQAELGKIVIEELTNGHALTDYLLVSMFVEYIRSKPDIEGWVLINYPTNFDQAILLEEALSGISVPGVTPSNKICKSLFDIVGSFTEVDLSVTEIDERRYSKLVIDPTDPVEPPSYDTVLTAFIQVCPDEEILENIQQPSDVVLPEGDDSEMISKFYSDMGCLYSLYYKSFDYSTIKQLGKLIIGDFSIPPKSSIELFGEGIRCIEAEKIVDYKTSKIVLAGDKVERERIEKVVKKPDIAGAGAESDVEDKSKKGKKSKKDKSAGKDKKGKKGVTIVFEDKTTQIPEVKIVEIEKEEEEIENPAKPGEPGWRYLKLKLSEKIGNILTDLWTALEEVFINDMTQVLFMKKNVLDLLMPYIKYVQEIMNKHIIKPDDRQIYLVKFQENFNKFDYDFRRDNEFKAELHCLINEIRNKLFDLCDKKLIAGEQERHSLIYQSWIPRQLIELVNNYISGFQLELDRHMDSLIFINDYFTGLITQVPSEEVMSRENLVKFELENQSIHKIVNDFLLETTNENLSRTLQLLKDTLRIIYQTAVTYAQKRDNIAFAYFDKVKLLFCPENTKGKGKPKAKKNKKGAKTLLTAFEPSEIVKRNQDIIFDEWLCALKGEVARAEIYFQLLQHDMFENVELIIKTAKRVYLKLFEEIRFRYEKEMKCIKTACYIFSAAVEKEVPIQEELIFKDDELLINAEKIWFEPPPPKKIEPLPPDFIFTSTQLQSLIEIFHDLAVDGFIPNMLFTFVLQDVVVTDEINIVPPQWRKLSGRNVTEFSRRLFNNQKYIHWKDFIIYNLPVKIPSSEDIISLRNQFLIFDPNHTELIDRDCFKNIRFWFEDEFDDSNELNKIKNLLFDLYRINQQICNYTAMLLDFCKGECTQEGIAKALALINGRSVCWNKDIGKLFIKETLIKRKVHEKEVELREEEIKANKEFVGTILDDIIDTTVHVCDSVVITELENSIENIQEENEKEESDIGIKEEEITNDNEVTDILITVKSKELHSPTKETLNTEKEDSKNSVEEKVIEPNSQIIDVSDSAGKETSSEASDILPKFSNIAIGFEPLTYPPLIYFLLFEDIATVLIKSLADVLTSDDKQFFDIVCDIYLHCRNRLFNKEVLCHEFLNNKQFLKLMEGKTKFIAQVPGRIVEDMLLELGINSV
ncbi:sperm flagellar protein 2-like [Diorhabda sublineata]|uniref:sperm flagellar protein 2-like n=1 Tax=Diorhabda sublineata TaxID=1163346 RepID=UPI0024E1486D|nr:sperm flagellar protein 2-like [Diorhabda sublineata]